MSGQARSAAFQNREKKKQAAQNLLSVTLDGARALEAGDEAAYLNTLEAREAYLARIDALESEYAALSPLAEELSDISRLEDEAKALLKSVLDEDGRAREKGKTLMEEYRKKLKALRKSGKQVMGYTQGYARSDGVYIDKKR